MLGHVLRKEILDHLLSPRYLVLSALAGLIIWVSLYDGVSYYREQLAFHRSAQSASDDRLNQIVEADRSILWDRHYWGELFNFGYLIHKPPSVLSSVVRGLDPILGRTIRVKGYTDRRLVRSPASEEPELGIFPPLDLGLIVQMILGLFVLLLTYDAVCGEKERGTLSLASSFPVPKHLLLAGKMLGALLPCLAAFGLPLLVGVAAVLAVPEMQLGRPELIRLGLIALGFGLYVGTMTSAGLLASALTRRSSTSFVLLLAFWVSTVVVLPRLGLIAAEAFRGAPSVAEHEGRRRMVFWDAVNKRGEQWSAYQEEYAAAEGRSPWSTPDGRAHLYEKLRQIQHGLDMAARVERDRIDTEFQNEYDAWVDLGVSLARLSPAFLLNNATVRLAGTGMDAHRGFTRACGEYLDRQLDWSHETFHRDSLRRQHPAKYGPFVWDVGDIPRFASRRMDTTDDIHDSLLELGMLAVWGVALFAAAYVAMLRFDVR